MPRNTAVPVRLSAQASIATGPTRRRTAGVRTSRVAAAIPSASPSRNGLSMIAKDHVELPTTGSSERVQITSSSSAQNPEIPRTIAMMGEDTGFDSAVRIGVDAALTGCDSRWPNARQRAPANTRFSAPAAAAVPNIPQ